MSKTEDEIIDPRMEEVVKKYKLSGNLLLVCMIGIFISAFYMIMPILIVASVGAVIVAGLQFKLKKDAKKIMEEYESKNN